MVDKLAYSMTEAAEVLGVYTLAKRADFPSFKVGTRTLISAEGLQEWVAAQVGKEEAV